MEKKEWKGIEMKEACMRAAKAFQKLGIALNKLNPKEFVTNKSKYHK